MLKLQRANFGTFLRPSILSHAFSDPTIKAYIHITAVMYNFLMRCKTLNKNSRATYAKIVLPCDITNSLRAIGRKSQNGPDVIFSLKCINVSQTVKL